MRVGCKAGVAVGLALLLHAQPAGALTFVFTPVGSVPQQALDAFNLAGQRWAANFTNDVTININVGFAELGSNILAQNESEDWSQADTSYNSIRNLLTSAASANPAQTDDDIAVAHLPTGSYVHMLINRTSDNPNGAGSATWYKDGRTSPSQIGSRNNNLNLSVTRANYKVLSGTSSTLADATITFNSKGFTFDYNPLDGISGGAFDFVGLATHEIGHSLGFASGVDILDSTTGQYSENSLDYVSVLDLFRYSTESTAEGMIDWTADTRAKYFSIDGGATKLANFATGVTYGDGKQASHWKDNQSLGIMDPTAYGGEILKITAFDRQAFDVIGFTLNNTFTWTGGSGDWNNALKWNTASVPSASIDAALDSAGTYSVKLTAASSAKSLSVANGAVTLDRAGKNLTLGGDLTIASSATLTASGSGTLAAVSIINSGSFTHTTGTLSLAGNFTNHAGTALLGGIQNWSATSSLVVNGGTVTLLSDAGGPANARLSANVNAGGRLVFNASQHLKSLTIAGGSVSASGGGLLIATQNLSITQGGQLDLEHNDLLIQSDSANRTALLSAVQSLVAAAHAGGTWSGSGITSSAAAADPLGITALAVLLNDRGNGIPFFSNFDGEAVGINDILVKYTYYGDTDLNGVVDASDFFRFDRGLLKGLSGWINGDFNYDGLVDTLDRDLMDWTFLNQGQPLEGIGPMVSFAALSVPEPNTLLLLSLASLGILMPRRRNGFARTT